MKTVPEPPGNDFEPLGKPIRPEAKPAPAAPVPTENSRIGRRLDGMLETMIPGNEGKVPKSDFPSQALGVNASDEYYRELADYRTEQLKKSFLQVDFSQLEQRVVAFTDNLRAQGIIDEREATQYYYATSTGRLSSSEPPAEHQLPKANPLYRIFLDDRYWCVGTNDYVGVVRKRYGARITIKPA